MTIQEAFGNCLEHVKVFFHVKNIAAVMEVVLVIMRLPRSKEARPSSGNVLKAWLTLVNLLASCHLLLTQSSKMIAIFQWQFNAEIVET